MIILLRSIIASGDCDMPFYILQRNKRCQEMFYWCFVSVLRWSVATLQDVAGFRKFYFVQITWAWVQSQWRAANRIPLIMRIEAVNERVLTAAAKVFASMRCSLNVPRTLHPVGDGGLWLISSHGACASTITLPTYSNTTSRCSGTNLKPFTETFHVVDTDRRTTAWTRNKLTR